MAHGVRHKGSITYRSREQGFEFAGEFRRSAPTKGLKLQCGWLVPYKGGKMWKVTARKFILVDGQLAPAYDLAYEGFVALNVPQDELTLEVEEDE